jgi:hypothetical protein
MSAFKPVIILQACLAVLFGAILLGKILKIRKTDDSKKLHIEFEASSLDKKMLLLSSGEAVLMMIFAVQFRAENAAIHPLGLIVLQNLMLFGLALSLVVIFFAALTIGLADAGISNVGQSPGSPVVQKTVALTLLAVNVLVTVFVLLTDVYAFQAVWTGFASVLLFLATVACVYLWKKLRDSYEKASGELRSDAHVTSVLKAMKSKQLAARTLFGSLVIGSVMAVYSVLTVLIAHCPTGSKAAFSANGESTTILPDINAILIGISVISLQSIQLVMQFQKAEQEAVIHGQKPAPAHFRKVSRSRKASSNFDSEIPESPTNREGGTKQTDHKPSTVDNVRPGSVQSEL